MRIGIDCRLLDETGVGRYIRNMIQNLQVVDKKNSYVLFALSKDYKNLKSKMSNLKWKIVNANIRWHTIEEQIKFPQILNRENLDLVHFPYVSVPIFYNKPFVVTIHDLIPYHFPTGEASTLPLPLYQLKLLGYKFVISQVAKRAKKIITVSNATKDEIVDHLKVDPSKVVVTYEGVDNKTSNIKYQKSKIQIKNKKYFLYVGNAYPHKNLEKLVKAFSIICHPDPSVGGEGYHEILRSAQNDIKLVLVGREDYFYKRLKEEVSKIPIRNSIVFLGEATDAQLSELYKNALALVMPSLMEGFGLPALEAMGNECLVLASDTPALKEICGESAIYFDPYNSVDIENKMKIVLLDDSNHFAPNIEEGFKRARMFSWEKMVKETLKVYNES